MGLGRYLQAGGAVIGLGLRRRRRRCGRRVGEGADVRNVEVLACFFGAVESVYLAELDMGSAATDAVLGLAAVDRGEVAVVSAPALTRLPLCVGRFVVEAVRVHVVSPAPAMTSFVL